MVGILLTASCGGSGNASGGSEALEGPVATTAASTSTIDSEPLTSDVSTTTTTTTTTTTVDSEGEEAVSTLGPTTIVSSGEEVRIVIDDFAPSDVPAGVSQQLALFGGGGYINCEFDMLNGDFLDSAESERRGLWLLGQYFRTDGGEGPAAAGVGVRGAVLVFCLADTSLVPGETVSVSLSGAGTDVTLNLEVIDTSSSQHAAAIEFDSMGLLSSGNYEISVDTGSKTLDGSFSLVESSNPHMRETVLYTYSGDDLRTDDLGVHILGHESNTSVELLLYQPISDLWEPVDKNGNIEIPVYRFVKNLGSVVVDSKGSADLVIDIPDVVERRYCVITDQMESAYQDLFETVVEYVQGEEFLSSGWDAADLLRSADPCQLAPGFGPFS